MNAINAAAAVLALPPTVLLAVFTAEVVAGLCVPAASDVSGAVPDTVVLIPAHDEAAGIAGTIAALRLASGPAIRLLVVADNCTDDTAARARAAGAEVVERTDPAQRGKGYALAFGREAIMETRRTSPPPACVVVLDADCAVGGRGVGALARAAVASGQAVQARNLQRPDLAAAPTAQISNFAFLVKNLVRQRGMVRLGGVAALTGTGMAIPWEQFALAPLASADLAEDLALGVWLTRSGKPPRAEETVHVWSDAATGGALMVQRKRWERGFLSVARAQALPLIGHGIASVSRSRLWLGLHLIVPPLALLFATAGAAVLATALLILLGASMIPALLVTGATLAAGLATIAAWSAEGRGQISGKALLRTPLYIATKLPLYRSLLRGGSDTGWVRTHRPGDADASRDDTL